MGWLFLFLFRQFHYHVHLLHDAIVVLPTVGHQTVTAILDTIIQISKVTAAFVPQRIERTIAEQAAKFFLLKTIVTGKKLTLPILIVFIVFQILHLRPRVAFRRLVTKFHSLSGFRMSECDP